MSFIYGIPGLQAVTQAGNSTSQPVSFNGAVDFSGGGSFVSTFQFKADQQFFSNFYLYFGDGFETAIFHDAATNNLVLDPTIGGGIGVFVGNGLISAPLTASNLGLLDSSPQTNIMISGDRTDTSITNGIQSAIEHQGSTTSILGASMTAIHNGTSTTQNVTGGFFEGQIKVKNNSTATIVGVNAVASLNASVVIASGTVNLQNKFEVTGAGGTHIGGTAYSRSLWATEPPALSGTTHTSWAGLFSGDTQINSNKKLLLEGSDTVKGDTYLVYDTASTELQMYVNNVKVLGSTSTTLTAYVGTSGFGGGGGGSANSVTTSVNFGASFSDKAQTVVTGQTWVTATTEIVAIVKCASGTDPDELYLIKPEVVISDLVSGTGFTVTVYTEAEAKGTYDVMCIGV